MFLTYLELFYFLFFNFGFSLLTPLLYKEECKDWASKARLTLSLILCSSPSVWLCRALGYGARCLLPYCDCVHAVPAVPCWLLLRTFFFLYSLFLPEVYCHLVFFICFVSMYMSLICSQVSCLSLRYKISFHLIRQIKYFLFF